MEYKQTRSISVPPTYGTPSHRMLESRTIETFKSKLDKAWYDHPTKYTIDDEKYNTNDQDQFVEAM